MHRITDESHDGRLTRTLNSASEVYREELRHWAYSAGAGMVQKVILRPGLTLLVETFDFAHALSAGMVLHPDPVEIFFCISGQMTISADALEKDLVLRSGEASLFFTSPLEGTGRIFPGEPLKLLTIRFYPELLCPQVNGLARILPPAMVRTDGVADQESLIFAVPLTPDMKMAVFQILGCPYEDALKRIYLDTKTIELMLLYFAALTTAPVERRPTAHALTRNEVRKIHRARAILETDLEDPPRLRELARQVGLNKDKLNQGFRREFGTSVFACLRRQKMETAQRLLEANDMNVTEVAYSLGYSQPGTFSRAFKQYFGVNPKTYLRRVSATP